ncbi:hypothetical protein FHX74_003851 [Friedmanniella endophytica]|uniref:DUF2510 domain-containing protein n=1 Tax=Microlunatus kandeliicorticis TaxID=1759536 RepID=A0A7W3P7N1_9ACTN|nr:DUF2510 domain-containing protein [Microlunatus kandeliicorticis]MBA8796198.1 hypothetical protein [Microlunatus kandeliicorticis]
MARAGWYPDPGGQPGLYRYWDGKAWSAGTSTNPASPPPSQALGGTPQPGATGSPYGAGSSGPYGGQSSGGPGGAYGGAYGQQTGYRPGGTGPAYGQSQPAGAYQAYQQAGSKPRRWPWWIGIGAVVAIVAVVVVLVVRGVTGGGLFGSPSGQGSSDVCPTVSKTPTESNEPNDGRVHGGPVSYPLLGSPWSAPTPDDRIPFGSDVLSQTITVEANYQPGANWVASVLIGQLIAGDGFYSPEEGSKIVVRCIIGAFYGNAVVTRDDTENKATKVDGHDAWIVRSHLSFDIPNLRTKGETMIVVIVNAGVTSGIFYASIPDTSKQYLEPAEEALKGLQVD